MKVLTCDSGISRTQSSEISHTDIGYGIWDKSTHGSTVCDIIKLIAPETEIESIKILDDDNSTTLEILLKTLEYCTKRDCDIICLALTVDYDGECVPLTRVVEYLAGSGKILISANSNRHQKSFPACYHSVIGCRIQKQGESSSLYSINRPVQSILPLNAIIRKIENNAFSIISGNSLSCAVMTGEIAYVGQKLGFDKMQNMLEKLEWKDYQIYKYMPLNNGLNLNKEKYKTICFEIESAFSNFDVDMHQPLYKSLSIESMIKSLMPFGYFGDINSNILQLTDFKSIETLAKYIYISEERNNSPKLSGMPE